MASMSYCLFRNTLGELKRCVDTLDDDEQLSKEEAEAAVAMVALARRLVSDHDDIDAATLAAPGTIRTRPLRQPEATGLVCEHCDAAPATREATASRSGNQWVICDSPACLKECKP